MRLVRFISFLFYMYYSNGPVNLFYLYFLICLLSSSCISTSEVQKNKWELNNGIGLKQANEEFSNIIFINESIALLTGTNYTSKAIIEKKFNEQNAIVYKSSDSTRSWKETELAKGRVQDGVLIDSIVYLVTNRSAKGIYGKTEESIIFASEDSGNTWNSVVSFPFLVRNIRFSDSLKGIIRLERYI